MLTFLCLFDVCSQISKRMYGTLFLRGYFIDKAKIIEKEEHFIFVIFFMLLKDFLNSVQVYPKVRSEYFGCNWERHITFLLITLVQQSKVGLGLKRLSSPFCLDKISCQKKQSKIEKYLNYFDISTNRKRGYLKKSRKQRCVK